MIGKRLFKANLIAKRKIKTNPHLKEWYNAVPNKQRVFGIIRKTRVFCSNPYCCGNPRRIKGQKILTKQERISLEKEKSEKLIIVGGDYVIY